MTASMLVHAAGLVAAFVVGWVGRSMVAHCRRPKPPTRVTAPADAPTRILPRPVGSPRPVRFPTRHDPDATVVIPVQRPGGTP